MNPQEVLDAIVRVLKNSSTFSGGDYVTHKLDLDGEDNTLVQPVVSIKPIANPRSTEWDSDFAGYETNDDGEKTARIFRASWDMSIEAHIVTASGNDALDSTSLGFDFQNALLPYDDQQEGKPFPDGDGGTEDEIKSFTVAEEGERDDDLAGPGLRRWRTTLAASFVDERTVSGARIDTVVVPQTDEFQLASNADDPEDADLVWNAT